MIETKYNINDDVWFMAGYSPVHGKIEKIIISSAGYTYMIGNLEFHESRLFPNKEELKEEEKKHLEMTFNDKPDIIVDRGANANASAESERLTKKFGN